MTEHKQEKTPYPAVSGKKMSPARITLVPGSLRSRTLEGIEKALRSGALQPIHTETSFVHDSGVDFMVRTVSSLARKAKDTKERAERNNISHEKPNPFLPYDPEMFVANISDTHLCLLNKFNVIDHHLLIVTRVFEHQDCLLTLDDFTAMWACMAEFDGLAFYNGGKIAGASQPHKHLQMIPLPMANTGPRIPIEPLLTPRHTNDILGVLPGLPFVHSFARLNPSWLKSPIQAAQGTVSLYRDMLEAVGLNRSVEPEGSHHCAPYNLLLTRQWMLLVPRSVEFFESISVNALGFAGALLVLNEQQMSAVKEQGCMAVLKSTALSCSPGDNLQDK